LGLKLEDLSVGTSLPESKRRVTQEHINLYAEASKDFNPIHLDPEFARQADEYHGIISIGGDGTLHEIINGINLENQKVAIIPAGTINCLARFLGIRDAEYGMKMLGQGIPEKMDLISMTVYHPDGKMQHRFVWGFLTFGRLVNITTLAGKFRILPKFMRYFFSTILNHVICKKNRAKISMNNGTSRPVRFSSFIINNATASHFSSVPSWAMQDGTAELQIVNHNPVTQFIASFSRFIKLPLNFSWINGVKSLQCEFEKPADMMADGEIIKQVRRIELEVIRNKLEIVVPSGKELTYKIPGFYGKWKRYE